MSSISDELLVTVVLGFAAVLLFGTIGYIGYRIFVADRRAPVFPKKLLKSLIKRFSLKESGFMPTPEFAVKNPQGGWIAEFHSSSLRIRIVREETPSNHLNLLLAPAIETFGEAGVFSLHYLLKYFAQQPLLAPAKTDEEPDDDPPKTEMEQVAQLFTENLDRFNEFFAPEGYEERRKAARDYIAAQEEAILTSVGISKAPDGKWNIPPFPSQPPQFRRAQPTSSWSCIVPAGLVIGLIAILVYAFSSNNEALALIVFTVLWALPWIALLILVIRIITHLLIRPELKVVKRAIYQNFPQLRSTTKVVQQKFFVSNQVWLVYLKSANLAFHFYGDTQRSYLFIGPKSLPSLVSLEWLAAFHFEEVFRPYTEAVPHWKDSYTILQTHLFCMKTG